MNLFRPYIIACNLLKKYTRHIFIAKCKYEDPSFVTQDIKMLMTSKMNDIQSDLSRDPSLKSRISSFNGTHTKLTLMETAVDVSCCNNTFSDAKIYFLQQNFL